MEHDICLNIHYSAPEEVWNKINNVYKTMSYWNENEKYPHWQGENIDICASVEAGGIQISGTMPDDLWHEWYSVLKARLTESLGYEIGEPEEGYRFKFWNPFEKKFSDIKIIDEDQIVFNDGSTFYWNDFERIERDCLAKPQYFIFKSPYIELWILFDETGLFSRKKNMQNFHDFHSRLNSIGVRSLDLT